MAWSFGDSFDLYAASTDMVAGYWDSGTVAGWSFVAGRFAGSQALNMQTAATNVVKSSGVNDAVHHFVVSFKQTAAISGSTLAGYLELFDGATAQCTVVFRSDGAILLTSGGPAGTTLATYTNAFPVTATWYAFEIEVVINSASGSFAVRKNGNTVNDFSLGSLNTRTSANNYANKLQFGMNASLSALQFDDLFWKSDATSVAWLGDIRCYARMPASDASVTFTRSPATFTMPAFGIGTSANTGNLTSSAGRYNGLTSQGGSLTGVAVTFVTGYTGNLKCAIFACTSTLGAANSIGAVLGTATAIIVNPVAGANTFTFSPSIALPAGTLFYVGVATDTASGASSIAVANLAPANATAVLNTSISYAAFPVASAPTSTALTTNYNFSPIFTPTNSLYVSDPQQDGLTSHVFDSNPGDADFYGVASIASTPTTVIATTIRAYMQKSDAGTRTAAVQLKSGATTVASPTLVLTTSGFAWAWRTDLVDPATGATWTPAAVNNATIGPKVVA